MEVKHPPPWIATAATQWETAVAHGEFLQGGGHWGDDVGQIVQVVHRRVDKGQLVEVRLTPQEVRSTEAMQGRAVNDYQSPKLDCSFTWPKETALELLYWGIL